MAATHTVLVGVLKQGDHVICTNPVYGSTLTLLKTVASRFGVETTFIDTSSVPVVEKSFRANTRILFLETPANPTLAITDIAAMSELARRKSAVLVVDNTFASPIVQKPLTLGADIVVHSMTKYLNGHADVVAGIVVAKQQDLYDQLRTTLHNIGCNIDPHAAFLVHRGIKTLAVRMDRHCANAARVAAFLEKHPKIAWVRYPGLASHPHHELAMRQMKNGGGMVSLELKGGLEAGKVLMNSVQLCVLAVSLGGVETLIEHPASMTHCKVAPEDRERGCVSDGLVRLSIGIENVDDLIADLKQALDKI
jgi:methionine-gamma-lyase